jgi:non-heme chloroperoxidase
VALERFLDEDLQFEARERGPEAEVTAAGPQRLVLGVAQDVEAVGVFVAVLVSQGMMGGAKAHYDGIVAFSQTDFTEDLKGITVPVLMMHGDDDQIVPYADSGPLSAELVQNGTLKTYKGFPHGMPTTEAETINADLLAFLES